MARIVKRKDVRSNLKKVLREVNEMRRDGGKDWREGKDLESRLSIVVSSAAEFTPEIDRTIWNSLQLGAIVSLLEDYNSDLSIEGLVSQLRRVESEYLGRPIERFVVMSNLSVQSEGLVGVRKKTGIRLVLERRPPNAYLKHRHSSEFQNLLGETLVKAPPFGSLTVRVFARGRVESEAYQRASKALDLMRGIWNFSLTYGRSRRVIGGAPQPLARIVRGPVETVHRPGGALVGNSMWFFPRYSTSLKAMRLGDNRPGTNLSRLKELEKWIYGKLSRSPLRSMVEEGLIRYSQAIDSIDWDQSFLRLWHLLEWLCNADRGDRADYETLVRRATSVFLKHRQLNKGVLNGLRTHRNRMVHDGIELSTIAGHYGFVDEQQYVQRLKVFVDTLLYALINNGPKIKHRTDFCQLLDDCYLGQMFSERRKASRFEPYMLKAAGLA